MGGGAPRDVDGVPVAGGQESGGGVARKLPRDDVVLMVGLAGARGQWIAGMTARPSGGGSTSSPALRSDRFGARGRNWVGWGAPVGRGDALGAMDRGWEAAAVAVDGEQKLRRWSGEVESSGRGKAVQLWVWECKSGFMGNSRICSGSRRRHGRDSRSWRARQRAWRLGRRRRDVKRQGGVQRGLGSGGAGAGAARGTEGNGTGAVKARHMASEAAGVRREQKQSRGTGGR
jgi:hypothetical protein